MRKLALVLMVVAGLASVATGLRYLATPEFMPYHAVVAGKAWAQLEPGFQAIVLGMLRIVGAGFAGSGVALLAFAAWGVRGGRWPAAAAAVLGATVWVPTIWVCLFLRSVNARAEPPLAGAVLLLAVILLASVLLWIADARSAPRPAGAEAQAA